MKLRAAALLVCSGLLVAASTAARAVAPHETPLPPALPDPPEPLPPAPDPDLAPEAFAEPLPPALASHELEAATGLVREWARAWSERRLEDFLAFYAADFHCPNGWPRKRWERQQRQRLGESKAVEVTVLDLEVRSLGAGRLAVRLRLILGSGSTSHSVAKTLELVRREDGWRIVEERAYAP